MDKLPGEPVEEAEVNPRSPLVPSPVRDPSSGVISSWCYLHSSTSFVEARGSDFFKLSETLARCSNLF